MSTDRADTVVPSGIDDPVELARAELRAALAAIEHKSNLPKRFAEQVERTARGAQRFAARRPGAALVGIMAASAAVGSAVWGIARLISR